MTAMDTVPYTCLEVSFLIKIQASDLQLYSKRDSDTDVSLKILRFFKVLQNVVYKTPLLQNILGRLLLILGILCIQLWCKLSIIYGFFDSLCMSSFQKKCFCQGCNEGFFLLFSYVVLNYDFEQIIYFKFTPLLF